MARRTLPSTKLRVLFCVAGGPRRGFGHIVRAVRLARALGVAPMLRVRGGASSHRALRSLGATEIGGPLSARLLEHGFDLVVVDDPCARAARRAIAAARRAGAVTVSVHDLGVGCLDADLIVDGSLCRPRRLPVDRALLGPDYAILDGLIATWCQRAGRSPTCRVLVALGGGRRASVSHRLGLAIATRAPGVEVRIAGGFMITRRGPSRTGGDNPTVVSLPPLSTLANELARAEVAVVGGGVSLYEAAASGTAAVGVAVVEAQRPTIEAFAKSGAALDGGRLFGASATAASFDALAGKVAALLADAAARARLGAAGRRLVDGHGAARVARAIADWAAAAQARRQGQGGGSRAA